MQAVLNLVHLYPGLLNLYGDRGNIITLKRRCAWRGIDLRVHEVGLGESLPVEEVDIFFMGGDQDREQTTVVEDLRTRHRGAIDERVRAGVPFLAVCGSYQLLKQYYRPASGPDLIGLGIIDGYTVHPGHHVPRCVGNIVIEWEGATIVGFENHGGRTYLGPGAVPLGKVIQGRGNNGEDGFEGARTHNLFGTYVHGSLLPKNPRFADYLLQLALNRRYRDHELVPLDDALELRAHDAAIARARSVRN